MLGLKLIHVSKKATGVYQTYFEATPQFDIYPGASCGKYMTSKLTYRFTIVGQ